MYGTTLISAFALDFILERADCILTSNESLYFLQKSAVCHLRHQGYDKLLYLSNSGFVKVLILNEMLNHPVLLSVLCCLHEDMTDSSCLQY